MNPSLSTSTNSVLAWSKTRRCPRLASDGSLWRPMAAVVVFVRGPVVEPFGTVAVFSDLYGNLWDLIGPAAPNDRSKAQG